MSNNKQIKALTTENQKWKKRAEKYQNKLEKKTSHSRVNCSREMKKNEFMYRKRSERNLRDTFSGLNNQYDVANSYPNQPSPSFRKPQSQVREKIHYKSPEAATRDQIVIINNNSNEYMNKLHPPTYKIKTSDKKPSKTRNIKPSESKNSKSEERMKRAYINAKDSQDYEQR